MDRQDIINKYKIDEERILVSKLIDKIEAVEKKNIVEATEFLSLHQQSILEKVLRTLKFKNYRYVGGYENSERKIIVIYPEKLEMVFEKDLYEYNNLIGVLRIILPNELRGKYFHKDYLGAIIKVGIKREKIGDIIVSLDGADIIVQKDIIQYLELSLKELTRFSKSQFTTNKIEELNVADPKTEIINIIIPSMRMDSIVSELIRTSRAKVIDVINSERVFINSELVIKNSKVLKEKDLITVRGKGRFKINKILNTTKKGNLVVEIEKYI